MTPRRYHPVWRVLAAAISIAVIVLLWQRARGAVRAPDWAEASGMVLVLLLLPFVAITGRAPAWVERITRRGA